MSKFTSLGGGGGGGGLQEVTLDADTGSATTVSGTASVVGTGGIATSGTGDTLTIDGSALGAGLVFIESQTASNVSSIEFTGFDVFIKYMLSFYLVRPSIDGEYLLLEMSNDGGSTWVTSGYQGSCIHFAWNGTTATSTNSTSHWVLSGPLDSNTALNTANGQIFISPRGATKSWVNGTVSFGDTAGNARLGNIGGSAGSTGLSGLRLRMSSGNILTGQFVLYGMRDS